MLTIDNSENRKHNEDIKLVLCGSFFGSLYFF